MRRSVCAVLVASLALGGLAALDACSLDASGVGTSDASSDTTVPVDTGVDGSDAETDASCGNRARCNGQCVDSCEGCTAGTIICPSTRVCGKCDNCPEFVACTTCGGTIPVLGCRAASMDCPLTPENGACSCEDGGANTCPNANQVCSDAGITAVCLRCGQSGTAGGACPSGKVCNADSGVCE
jgi:hypothetical protein